MLENAFCFLRTHVGKRIDVLPLCWWSYLVDMEQDVLRCNGLHRLRGPQWKDLGRM